MSRILIAEDERGIASFLEKGLRSQGFATVVAETGTLAASMAREDSFDLVILDLGLPEMDGLQVLAEIRGRGDAVPVIVLTARDSPADRRAGLAAGADDYLTKPFAFGDLLALVRVRLADQ